MKAIRNPGYLLACLVLLTSLALGQNPLGRLSGTVRDQNGAVIAGATVTLINEGTRQQQTTTTSNDGAFLFAQLSAGSYAVKIEMTGFKAASYTQVKVDPGQEYSLAALLEVGETSQVVEITAGSDLVHTTSPEITNTVTQRQIVDLPLNGRNVLDLVKLQAGVQGIATRTTTAINGGRPTWTQITQDGINIQDNFIRTNSIDFVPNRPTSDIVGEFTISTNTQGADAAGGASQVKFITPSGTNEYHFSLFEFNRNSALGANTWFRNATVDPNTGRSLSKSFLNRNQFGGTAGGPIIKDRLFFFGYYEEWRQVTNATPNNTIPVHDDFLTGTFRYVVPGTSTVRAVNVLQLAGVSIDPKVKSIILDRVPRASNVNNFDVGNSTAARLLNTAGYRFTQTDLNLRRYYGGKADYQLNAAHNFEFVFSRMRETDDRTDLDTTNPRPLVFTDATSKRYVGAWRWLASDRLSNELRIGANLAPVAFESNEDWGGVIFSVPFVTNRVATFQPQGRDTRTFQYIDNASYITGNHSFQFGGSLQKIKVRPYNFAGRFPTVGFGFSTAAPTNIQLTAGQFPTSISAADLSNANALVTFLGGIITSVSQTFQVKDKSSGFVAGIPNERNFTLDNYAFYFQDNWKFRPNLSIRAGLKWEYFSPIREDDNLLLLPTDRTRAGILNPNGTVDFVTGGLYNKDLNNFGPTAGFAWDPFRDGKTSIRAGYTMAFVNEESITSSRNAAIGNAGLDTAVSLTNQFATVNAGIPKPTATFKVPRTYADQLNTSLSSAAFTIDPNIQQPYVHQISVSIEREIPFDLVVEGRYVSTMGRKIWQGIDLNQTNAATNKAFFDDFMRARSNGFIALNTPANTPGCTTATCGVFNPAFNASLPGSQALSVLTSSTFGGGFLTSSTVRSVLQTGQVGELSSVYMTGAGAAVAATSRAFFLANPGIFVADIIESRAQTDYHAFQGEVRRRFKNGLYAQMNYTFSKVLSNSSGTSQSRFEPYLDNDRPQLEKSRAEFDLTHIMHANFIYELPFGKGQRFAFDTSDKFFDKIFNKVLEGWQIGTIMHWQSGAPISILSSRGTFNRIGRSGGQGANTTLSKEEIKKLFGIRKLPDGRIFYIDPSVIGTDGRAVGTDNLNNSATFAGQVFFNPSPGAVGQLQRLQFDGPAQFDLSLSLIKKTRIKERISAEFRTEVFNLLNHPSFFVGDYDVNSTSFGRVTSLNQSPRIIQLGFKLNF